MEHLIYLILGIGVVVVGADLRKKKLKKNN